MKRLALPETVLMIFAFSCAPIQTTAKTPGGVDLARLNGWDIVVADDAIASEIYAAEEFQELFRQASGVKLPIVRKIDRYGKSQIDVVRGNLCFLNL